MSPLNHPVVRRLLTLLAVLPLIVLCAGCADFWVADSSIQKVTVSPSTLILRAGATPASSFTFTSTSLTVGGTTKTNPSSTTWSSSNTSVATFADQKTGVITAAASASGNQTATITATDGGQSGTATVLTYTGTIPTSTSLALAVVGSTSIAVGGTAQVNATADINDNSAFPLNKYVSWTTNSASICTVSTTGFVTGVATGSCTVTASAQFSDVTAAVTDTVTITVGGII